MKPPSVISGESQCLAKRSIIPPATTGPLRNTENGEWYALARIECPMSVNELGAILDDALLRPAAFTLLGQSGDDLALECLLKGITLDSRASREAAMAALLRVISRSDGSRIESIAERIAETARSSDQLIVASVERLADAGLATRLTLVQFLGLTRDPRCAIPILEAGRDEAIAEVAHATLASLGEIALESLQVLLAGLLR